MNVLVALSGGVDSAVAAARTVAAGHAVTGVHFALSRPPAGAGPRDGCAERDTRDAGRIADRIGIPFAVWDLTDRFRTDVIDDFVAEYAAGRTPNPCLRCNERVKFAAVLDRAVAMGFDATATGHYARIGTGGQLRRATDRAKDQSYVLAGLTRGQRERTVLPLGDSTKAEVRAEAAAMGLAVAEKPDSTDVCFIAGGDTGGFLAERLGRPRGDIVDAASGAVLGHHDGAYRFTVGQRRGLGLGTAAADLRPRYVLSVSAETNTVTVGPCEALDVTTIEGIRPVWAEPPAGPVRCEVQVRAHGTPVPATVVPSGDGMVARLDRPVRGVATGQGIVAYLPDPAGDLVVCAATIAATG